MSSRGFRFATIESNSDPGAKLFHLKSQLVKGLAKQRILFETISTALFHNELIKNGLIRKLNSFIQNNI